MGLCASQEAVSSQDVQKQASKDLDKTLVQQYTQNSRVFKLLLLGSGESGKSTMFKQMKQIYGKGFTDEDKAGARSVVYANILTSMKVLVQQAPNFGEIQNKNSAKVLMDMTSDEEVQGVIDSTLGVHLAKLWADPGIQAAYEKRAMFQLNDSTAYYMGRIHIISEPCYIPSEQDFLRTRVPTTGIVEKDFEIEGNKFKMMDVGGQRSERKKWIHCFEKVTAVLFVAGISAYDQVLYEDDHVNRVNEDLTLFAEVSNSQWFEKTAMIIFLNKKDLLEEKLPKVPLSNYFPEYKGNSYNDAIAFFKDLFTKVNTKQKDLYIHATCATDTNNVQTVFTYVKDIVIKRGLVSAGLM